MPNSYTPLTLVAGSASPNGTSQLNYGPFDFEYLNKDDIKFAVLTPGPLWADVPIASINETTKIITLSSSVVAQYPSLTITSARIYRATTTNALVDFTAGSRISEADLDTAYRQGLFAAQEASEDASGSASRAITTNSDIQDGAVTASKLATDSVEAVKIKDGVVGATKLASTLDLSSKNVTLSDSASNNAVSQTAVIRHINAIKSAIDISSGMVGVLPKANGGTPNNVLESFYLGCDGIEFTLPGSGRSFTPEVVTASQIQTLSSSYALINGSTVQYTPPAGTSVVIYEFRFFVGAGTSGSDAKAAFRLYLDDVQVTDYYSVGNGIEHSLPLGWHTVKHAFRIGTGSNFPHAGSGRVTSWTSNKTITLKGRGDGASAKCHSTFYDEFSTSTERYIKPSIGITALA